MSVAAKILLVTKIKFQQLVQNGHFPVDEINFYYNVSVWWSI